MQFYIIGQGRIVHRTGIDDVGDLPVFHQLSDVVEIGLDMSEIHRADPKLGNDLRRSLGSIELHAEIRQLFRCADKIGIIVIVHRKEDAHIIFSRGEAQRISRGDKPLVDRLVKGGADAEDFACRLHFRTENGVHVRQFFKAEYRHLDGIIWR